MDWASGSVRPARLQRSVERPTDLRASISAADNECGALVPSDERARSGSFSRRCRRARSYSPAGTSRAVASPDAASYGGFSSSPGAEFITDSRFLLTREIGRIAWFAPALKELAGALRTANPAHSRRSVARNSQVGDTDHEALVLKLFHVPTAARRPQAARRSHRKYLMTSIDLGVICPFQPKVMALTNIGKKTATQTTHIPVRRVRAADGSTG